MLKVTDLSVDYVSMEGRVHVLNNVSFEVKRGEVVGIVGESGSGKTTLGLAILRLLDTPPAQIMSGSINFEGDEVLNLSSEKLPNIRGTGMNMVFQESLVSLNPVYRVESQINESIDALCSASKTAISKEERGLKMIEILQDLYLDKPEQVLKKYPHELSGGMRQRVSMAMSIIQTPKLLILDEPTTGLDAYVQSRIMQIIKTLNKEYGISMILITHDLTVASQICDRIYVMYAGRVVEAGSSEQILEYPLHPYSETLLAALPKGFESSPPLPIPQGDPPDLKNLPLGCKFNPRCAHAMDVCKTKEPVLTQVGDAQVSCWKYS